MITAILTDPDGKVLRASYDHDGHAVEDDLLTQLDGFSGGVGVDSERLPRSSGPGNFPTDTRRTFRTLTMSALIERDERGLLWAEERRVSGLFQGGGTGRLDVIADGERFTLQVDLDGEVKIDVNLSGGYLTVQVPLHAPDPRIYGPEEETYLFPIGTGVGLEYPLGAQRTNPQGEAVLSYGTGTTSQDPVVNRGNATAWPVFTVVGDFPSGFILREGGRTFSWPVATVPQAPVAVHMSGSVIVGGVDQSALAGAREWFGIPPGGTIHPEFEPIQYGSGYCEVSTRPTYL